MFYKNEKFVREFKVGNSERLYYLLNKLADWDNFKMTILRSNILFIVDITENW
jgi:hypothetical protein